MVGQYFWGTLQAHRGMDDFLRTQLNQHPKVDTHITLYLFGHRDPQDEVLALIQRVEAQAKNINQMENTCKELQDRVNPLTEKASRFSKK